MNRFLRWLLGRDLRHTKGDPSTCPACPPLAPLPHVYECDCGRQHPAGWICACSSRGEL